MEVVAGRTAGRTDIAENIALLHLLPGAHDVGGHMAVARLDRIAMFDLDIIAITAEALSAADDAVGGRIVRSYARRRKLDSAVACAPDMKEHVLPTVSHAHLRCSLRID